MSMTSRERVLAALSHQTPDRVPLDLGSSIVSSINVKAYDRLKEHLNLDLGPTRVFDRRNQLAVVDEAVLDLLGIDTVGVTVTPPEVNNVRAPEDAKDEYSDAWGVTYYIEPGHDSYFAKNTPLGGEISVQDILDYPWPNPDDPALTLGLRERLQAIRAQTERAIVLTLPGSIVQHSQLMRGFSDWFMDVILAPERLTTLMDKIMELQMAFNANYLAAVGDIVDAVFLFDDIAMQDRMVVSPTDYAKLIKPRLCQYFDFLHSKTSAKLIYHTDGAIAPVLNELADMPIHAVNPLQVSAKGMADTAALKQLVGQRLAFWGGVDTQDTMPNGTPDDVRQETLLRIETLNQQGGYVLGAVHNIQADVPPENIVALFEAALGRKIA